MKINPHLFQKYLQLNQETLFLGLRAGILAFIFSVLHILINPGNINLIIALLGVFVISLIEANAIKGVSARRLNYSLGMVFCCAISFGLGSLVASNLGLTLLILLVFLFFTAFSDDVDPLWSTCVLFVTDLFIVGTGVESIHVKESLFYGNYFILGGFCLFTLGYFERLYFKKKYDLNKPIVRLHKLFEFSIRNLRFAMYLVTSVMGGYLLSYYFKLELGFWVPMTILLVLKAQHDHAWLRIRYRLWGTLLGALFALGLSFLIANLWVLAMLLAIVYFMMAVTIPKHYGAYVFFLTIMIAILYKLAFFNGIDVTWHRVLNTVIAILLVITLLNLVSRFKIFRYI